MSKSSIKSYRVPESACPYCGYTADGSLGPAQRMPKAGDVSVCVECASFSVFDESLQVRRPTPDEYSVMKDDPQIKQFQRIIRGRIA